MPFLLTYLDQKFLQMLLMHLTLVLKVDTMKPKIDDDHRLLDSTYPVLKMVDGKPTLVDEPALTAINMRFT